MVVRQDVPARMVSNMEREQRSLVHVLLRATSVRNV